ncbi:MarR family winged helix-turn-helix transcriptional regulator [Deinococcus yavapaiensis]|uniref:DNA-binding MarR family transcriptional regulator n=1 Tax=Deinococcus yavapaiensis KR-236 TaxID=694435 RepID=A0A318S9Z8_9DEIO|nr:MarR family transcriptional regulator [Deinococcus yavapaiensis]PYE55699.1 DNA-binding MarR family transcriptional regulator [Deinococcus yavapaiensis KR-236]
MDVLSDIDSLAFMRRVGRLYRHLHVALQPRLEQTLGLHPKEVQALSAVALGQDSPSAISARLGSPPPSTSRLIDRLVEANLLERHGHPDDLRRFRLVLTERGAHTLEEARALARTRLNELLGGVPTEELADADRALARLETRLGWEND